MYTWRFLPMDSRCKRRSLSQNSTRCTPFPFRLTHGQTKCLCAAHEHKIICVRNIANVIQLCPPCLFKGAPRLFKGVPRQFKAKLFDWNMFLVILEIISFSFTSTQCRSSVSRCWFDHFNGMPHHFKGVGLHFKGVGIHFNRILLHFKGVGIHFKGHTFRFVLLAAP